MSITILGTSHIAAESIQKIESTFRKVNPDIICLELDKGRLAALLKGESRVSWRMIFYVGTLGFLFALLARFVQKRLGNIVGVMPGSDMKKGFELAMQHKKKVILIDQPVQITLRKMTKALSREIWRFLWDMVRSPFVKELQFRVNFNLRKVPSEKEIRPILKFFEKRYPKTYYALVEGRNRIMAKALRKIKEKHPNEKILVVVGEGHRRRIEQLLKNAEFV